MNDRILDFLTDHSLREDSQSRCETKNGRLKKDNDCEGHAKRSEDSTSIIPENTSIGQQKNITSLMDCLSTEPQEDGRFLKGNSVIGKRKRQKKLVLEKHNQLCAGASSMLDNVAIEVS